MESLIFEKDKMLDVFVQPEPEDCLVPSVDADNFRRKFFNAAKIDCLMLSPVASHQDTQILAKTRIISELNVGSSTPEKFAEVFNAEMAKSDHKLLALHKLLFFVSEDSNIKVKVRYGEM